MQRKSRVATQGEDSCLRAQEGAPQKNRLCPHLDFGFPASEL